MAAENGEGRPAAGGPPATRPAAGASRATGSAVGGRPARRLVLFDFDGVIADSLEPTCVVLRRVMIAHGYPELATPEALLRFVDANWFEGLREAGVPLQVSDDIDDHVAEAVAAGAFAPYDDMPAVVTRVAARHAVLIVTSNRSDVVEACLARYGVEGVAEVLGGDKGHSKVDKIRAALRRYHAGRGTWFVGDTVGDVMEGRQAGVGTIAVTWGWHDRERLEKATPGRLVSTPAELLALLL